jgi:hypothetical protein
MYLSNIQISNYGPISDLSLDFPFDGQNPKPVLLVGQNGAGKSLFLANIVNALISGRQEEYDDNEVEQGRVYKYRMPSYISAGKSYTYIKVQFQSGAKVEELQLKNKKSAVNPPDSNYAGLEIYQMMPPEQSSAFSANFSQYPGTTDSLFKNQCCLYFPVHRNEEPAWLNIENATQRANFTKIKNISRQSNRDFVVSSQLESNRNWILDLALDRSLYEIQVNKINLPNGLPGQGISLPIFEGYQGESSNVFETIQKLIRIIMRQGENVRIGLGGRKSRQIAVMKDETEWIPNIFQLSTGETQLLNFFLTIIKDFDLSEASFGDMSNVKGIVVIDEIDTHLHTTHQMNVLPELIASFPKVQFIITTHSPLFLLGLERKLGADGFHAVQMPQGSPVAVEEFSEFGDAYEAFIQTERYKEEINARIEESQKPLLYVEGDYDIRYLKKAANLLNREATLNMVRIENGNGFGNLDKIWRGYENPTSSVLSQKLILLYDCDTKKPDVDKGQVYKRTMPVQLENPIAIGIENLFPEKTILALEEINPQFIDFQPAVAKRVRNTTIETPAVRSVNKDEKGNMCNWICEHGTKEDFNKFDIIFDILEEILKRN